MKKTFISFLCLFTTLAWAEVTLDLTDLTLPEALDALSRNLDENHTLHGFEYKLPRNYQNKDGKLRLKLEGIKDESIGEMIRNIAEMHKLLCVFDRQNEKVFITFRHQYGNEKPSLLEAVGAADRHMKRDDAGIDVKAFELVEAKLKYTRSEFYSGYWWHLIYNRPESQDGGANSIHVFVYGNQFVEHFLDSNAAITPIESMEATVDSIHYSPY